MMDALSPSGSSFLGGETGPDDDDEFGSLRDGASSMYGSEHTQRAAAPQAMMAVAAATGSSRGSSRAGTPPPLMAGTASPLSYYGLSPSTISGNSSSKSGRLRLLKPLDATIQGENDTDEDLLDPGCCHPAREVYRLHFLILLSSLSFASYFCYDLPSAVEDLIKRELEINTASFGMLYFSYCLPNIFLGLILGLIVDKYIGIRRGVIISSILTFLGHILLVAGAHYRYLWLMCIGRLLFGVGGEALSVMQNVFIVAWFRSKELKSVYAVTQTCSRLGSVLNLNLSGLLADEFGLESALLLGTIMCFISVISAGIIAFLDRRAELVIDKPLAEVGDEFIAKDIKKLPRSYWMLIAACVLFYAVFLPFIALGTEFFRYKYPSLSPGTLVSMPYMISLVGAPLFGLLIDRTKYRIVWAIAGLMMTASAFYIMAITLLNPYIPMVMLGFAYSVLVCSLWPMVAILIPSRRLGTAYGVLQALQNLFLTLVPPLYGYLFDHIGYMWMLIVFGMVLALALIAAELLMMFNYWDDEGLNGATPDEKARAERASRKAARRKGNNAAFSTPNAPSTYTLPPQPAGIVAFPPPPTSYQASALAGGSPTAANPVLSTNAPYPVNPISTPPLSVPGPTPLDMRKRYMTRLGISGPESYKAMPMSAGSSLK